MKRCITQFALPALALACLLSLPGVTLAQRGGHGGHGGGFGHAYGGHAYGGHVYGGYGHHYGYGGYGHHYGYGGYGLGYYGLGGWGYPGYGYGYGLGGYYGGYSTAPYYATSPYYYSAAPVYSDYYAAAPAYGDAATSIAPAAGYASSYPPSGTSSDPSRAYIRVHVPADAQVLFDNTPMQQTGTDRTFMTPPLQANQSYSYQVTARWMQNGRPVEQTRAVNVTPGEAVNVDFTAPVGDR